MKNQAVLDYLKNNTFKYKGNVVDFEVTEVSYSYAIADEIYFRAYIDSDVLDSDFLIVYGIVDKEIKKIVPQTSDFDSKVKEHKDCTSCYMMNVDGLEVA